MNSSAFIKTWTLAFFCDMQASQRNKGLQSSLPSLGLARLCADLGKKPSSGIILGTVAMPSPMTGHSLLLWVPVKVQWNKPTCSSLRFLLFSFWKIRNSFQMFASLLQWGRSCYLVHSWRLLGLKAENKGCSNIFTHAHKSGHKNAWVRTGCC